MVGDLEVSPISPPNRTVCPASPSLPWVPWALVPHLLRYYAPLRLPPVRLGSLRFSLARRYLVCFLSLCSLTARWRSEALHQHQGSWSAGTPALPAVLTRRRRALPSSRVPPVTTCSALHRPRWCPARLAVAPAGLQPSTRSTVSAFPWLHQGLSVRPQLYTFRGSIPQPVVLLPPASYSPHEACTRG